MSLANRDGAALRALADAALGPHADDRTRDLYTRYLGALALLCECAPYVDEPDFVDAIDTLLDDAVRHYPLCWSADGECRALAADAGEPSGKRPS